MPVTAAETLNARAAYAMRTVYEGQKTGAVICQTDTAKRIVFFESGYLVGAKSDLPAERLGEVMVRQGRIRREQLAEATRFIRSGHKLGHILVELGYLRGGEIEDYVRLQILEIASRILVATSPKRLVFSDRVAVEAVTLSPVSIADVFLACFKRLPDVAAYRDGLIDDCVLVQTEDALALAQGMKLSEEEGFVLDLVDGQLSVREILERAPLGPEPSLRMLLALKESGMIAVLEPRAAGPAPASVEPSGPSRPPDAFERELVRVYSEMQYQNHWQVLGLAQGAVYEDVARAYKELSARFDPEAHAHLPDAELREKLSFVHARIKEAFVTLSSQTSANVYGRLDEKESEYQVTKEKFEAIAPEEPAPHWNRPKDVEEAKRLFARAKRAYQEQDFWNTIELCRASIELDDANDPERFYLLGKALSENPRWRRDAEQNLNIAHKLEPWEPRYLVALGKLYEKEGLHARARRIFEQVKTMDPDYGLADGDPVVE